MPPSGVPGGTMSFIMEFVSNLIERNMEDPVARRRARDEHLRSMSEKAAHLCAPSQNRGSTWAV